MPRSFSYPSPTDVPLWAANELPPSGIPALGLVLGVIGGILLWRSARQSNPSGREERRGGVAFLVLGCLIGAAGLMMIWLD